MNSNSAKRRTVEAGRAGFAVMVMAISIGAAPVLAQAPKPADLEGRWLDRDRQFGYDIKPCGSGWCGVRVEAGACKLLELKLQNAPRGIGFVGTVNYNDGQVYKVSARLGQANLAIYDAEPNRVVMGRRMPGPVYDLSRAGPAQCGGAQPAS